MKTLITAIACLTLSSCSYLRNAYGPYDVPDDLEESYEKAMKWVQKQKEIDDRRKKQNTP